MIDQDYEEINVPFEKRKNFSSIFVVWVAFQISTIMLYFGSITIAGLTLKDAVIVLSIGTSVIALVSFFTGFVGAKTGMSTALLCEKAFGKFGGKFQQFFQSFIELGWFIVIIGITGKSLCSLLGIESYLNQGLTTFCIGLIFITSVLFGFKGIRMLSLISFPILVILLVFIMKDYNDSISGGLSWIVSTDNPSLLSAISVTIGTFITGATLSPDITRFSKNGKQGALSGGLSFMISIPLTLVLGALVSMSGGNQSDFIDTISSAGLAVPALIFLVLGNWSSGDTTLYLSIVPLKKLLPKIKRIYLVIFTGLVGAIIASFGITNYISQWLELLSILLPPLVGPIIGIGFFILRGYNLGETKDINYKGLLSWFLGFIGALIFHLVGFGIPSIFGILISTILFIILKPLYAVSKFGKY